MDWNCKTEGNRLLVSIRGEIDHHTVQALKAEVDQICNRKRIKHIILDFEGVDFMDSAGIGLLIGRYRYTAAQGGMTVAACVGKSLRRIFALSGLGRLIPVYPSVEEAKQGL